MYGHYFVGTLYLFVCLERLDAGRPLLDGGCVVYLLVCLETSYA